MHVPMTEGRERERGGRRERSEEEQTASAFASPTRMYNTNKISCFCCYYLYKIILLRQHAHVGLPVLLIIFRKNHLFFSSLHPCVVFPCGLQVSACASTFSMCQIPLPLHYRYYHCYYDFYCHHYYYYYCCFLLLLLLLSFFANNNSQSRGSSHWLECRLLAERHGDQNCFFDTHHSTVNPEQ